MADDLTELLAEAERRQKKAGIVGLYFILIPLVVGLAIVAYAGVQVRTLQRVNAELEKKQNDLKEIDARLEKQKQTAKLCNVTLGTVTKNSAAETASAFKMAVSEVPGTVGITIQVAYDTQLAKAKEIAAHLRELGYELPPDEAIEVRGKQRISKENYVRYFFDSDEALAQQIASQIKAIGVEIKPFSLVAAKDLGDVHPKTFEVRLGSDYNQ